MKKGETLKTEGNAVVGLPPAQELASVMIDAELIGQRRQRPC
jgi:hypothetical protein